MLKRSFSRKPSNSSSTGDKLALALVWLPQWISKMSFIPSMGICVCSSFAGSFDQFSVDTTPSDIGSDDHGEDPDAAFGLQVTPPSDAEIVWWDRNNREASLKWRNYLYYHLSIYDPIVLCLTGWELGRGIVKEGLIIPIFKDKSETGRRTS